MNKDDLKNKYNAYKSRSGLSKDDGNEMESALSKFMVEQNEKRDIEFAELQKEAESGNVESMFNLASSHDRLANSKTRDKKRNRAIAAEWYLKAAQNGHIKAQFFTGECFYNGEGVEKNDNKAFEWYMKAAEQKHAKAQYMVGICYTLEKGVTQDLDKAVEWLRKADDLGYYEAPYSLYKCYINDGYAGKDKAKALEYLRKGAKAGETLAIREFYRNYSFRAKLGRLFGKK